MNAFQNKKNQYFEKKKPIQFCNLLDISRCYFFHIFKFTQLRRYFGNGSNDFIQISMRFMHFQDVLDHF